MHVQKWFSSVWQLSTSTQFLLTTSMTFFLWNIIHILMSKTLYQPQHVLEKTILYIITGNVPQYIETSPALFSFREQQSCYVIKLWIVSKSAPTFYQLLNNTKKTGKLDHFVETPTNWKLNCSDNSLGSVARFKDLMSRI